MSEPRAIFERCADADELGRRAGILPRGGPVLLLHGFLATRRSLGALERRLGRDGFRVFSVELGGLAGRSTRRIDRLARTVRDAVELIYSRHPGMAPLTVIGHSKGGLIAAWWVKRLEGHRRVRTVITLGTPHRGTPLAWAGIPLAWLAPSVAQMRPGSGFLRRLGQGEWPAHVRLLTMYSRRDRIAPYPTAVPHAHAEESRSLEVDASHGDFLLKKTIYAAILNELRGGAPGGIHPAFERRAA